MSIVGNWEVRTAEELLAALQVATEFAGHKANGGHHASTIYTGVDRMVLAEETLTDGSKVMNLTFVRVEDNALASRVPARAPA